MEEVFGVELLSGKVFEVMFTRVIECVYSPSRYFVCRDFYRFSMMNMKSGRVLEDYNSSPKPDKTNKSPIEMYSLVSFTNAILSCFPGDHNGYYIVTSELVDHPQSPFVPSEEAKHQEAFQHGKLEELLKVLSSAVLMQKLRLESDHMLDSLRPMVPTLLH